MAGAKEPPSPASTMVVVTVNRRRGAVVMGEPSFGSVGARWAKAHITTKRTWPYEFATLGRHRDGDSRSQALPTARFGGRLSACRSRPAAVSGHLGRVLGL